MYAFDLVYQELHHACINYPKIRSAHEALAIIREEYLEVEQVVFSKVLDEEQLTRELVQLAAMSVRSLIDLGFVRDTLSEMNHCGCGCECLCGCLPPPRE